MRDELQRLQTVLARSGEAGYARMVETALSGAPNVLDAFVVSNELWGGPGSIADQAGFERGGQEREQIERALIDLGEAQIRIGTVNVRTEMWVAHFRQRVRGDG